MVEFTTVTREFRSLVSRRQHLSTFLGSVFAGLGIFVQNALQGNLPPALAALERHLFASYAVMLLVPCLILALRMARIHAGMVLNGVLYARFLRDQGFAPKGDPRRAARVNPFSVSFLYFLLADILAGYAAVILALALSVPILVASAIGAGVVAAWLALYYRFHHAAARFALERIADDEFAPFSRDDWEEHVSLSLEDANHGLIADLGFVGLIVFSVFETLTGLGAVRADAATDLASADIRRYGPAVYASLLVVTCTLILMAYVRVRLAIGHLSLQLDPSDRPFRPLRPTDSELGYALVAFLFAVSLHIFLMIAAPPLRDRPGLLAAIDAAALLAALGAEQAALVVAGRRARR